VHPSAYVDANACLAEGVVVSPFCFVASGASLETCCFLNVGSMVGHDSVLGPFCSVMPDVNISGGVTIKARAFIGVGAKILQGLSVGSDAVAGIGSIVVSNVRDGTTVMGNPAKVIREAKQP
jgi:acetyltransferase EpsM